MRLYFRRRSSDMSGIVLHLRGVHQGIFGRRRQGGRISFEGSRARILRAVDYGS